MLQITEKQRDALMQLIISGCYPNVTVRSVNNMLQGLDQLKPVKEKKPTKIKG